VTAWGSDVLISPVESIIYRFLIKFVFRQADLVTSMADHMTEHLISHRYVSKEKVLTLPFGVNINRFYPEQSKQPDKKSRFTVISTRRHNITCDVQTYIRAIPIILEQFPETCFLVGGDGPMREDLETLVKDLEIQKQVSFVGWIPYREMPEYLRRSDVAISTAVSDGNNVSLNEAMACGTFPIASNISANRQWIISEINGLLFKSGDYQDLASCVIRALSDFEMRENAVDLNWRIIKSRASWNKNMNKMTSYYKNLVLGIRD
jgi:glycosyltransferase involved in cell wall biosynthesis